MGMDKTMNSTVEPSKSTLDFQPDYIPELIDLFLTSDIELTKMMIILYPKYISPESLLDSLLDQMDKNQDELWQLRVCNTILLWADDHWEDFNDKMIYTLKFLSDKVESDYVAEKLYNQSQMKKKSSFSNWGYLSNTLYEESKSVPKQIAYKKFNWLGDCAVNLIADQLTAIEWDLFSNINSRDFLQQIWGKERIATRLTKSIEHFNFLSSLVKTLILIQDQIEYRAKVILKFIEIAKCLRIRNNFNSLLAILTGLSHSCISRLTDTMKIVQKHTLNNDFVVLQRLMSSNDTYLNYRHTLDLSNPPCIPYIGLFCSDVVKLTGHLTQIDDGVIDITHMMKIGDQLLRFKSFQIRNYSIEKDLQLIQLIVDSSVMTDEIAYERSRSIS